MNSIVEASKTLSCEACVCFARHVKISQYHPKAECLDLRLERFSGRQTDAAIQIWNGIMALIREKRGQALMSLQLALGWIISVSHISQKRRAKFRRILHTLAVSQSSQRVSSASAYSNIFCSQVDPWPLCAQMKSASIHENTRATHAHPSATPASKSAMYRSQRSAITCNHMLVSNRIRRTGKYYLPTRKAPHRNDHLVG